MNDITKEEYQKFDKIVQSTLINCYSAAKLANRLILINFNLKSKTDKCVIEIAKIAARIWQFSLEVDLPFFKYLFFKIRNRDIKIKRYKSFSKDKVDCQEMKTFVAESFKEPVEIYEKIYNAYYKKINRKELKND